ncbi:MAG: leucine-rich repeat protein [Clostridiales bacterium]|nr:leucine-rich repeat protein [Clostridiales bacterium]
MKRRLKGSISILLTLMLIVGVLPSAALTEDLSVDTEPIAVEEPAQEEVPAVPSGMDDFTISNGVLTAYSGPGGMIAIPSEVTEIAASVFRGRTDITEVAFNDGLQTIGSYAFYGCSYLTGDLIIPDSVTSIGSYAFYNCSGFSGRLQLSANLAVISTYAFCGCAYIAGELVIPDNVTNIDNYAFRDMPRLTSVVFGEKTARIGSGSPAFYGCTGITEITFKGLMVPALGTTGELTAMTNLKTIFVPREAYSAYVSAYVSRLPASAQITIKGESEDFIIQDGVLLAYLGAGGEVELPDGVLEIGMAAFQGNPSVTGVVFNEGLTRIGAYAFQNCTGLEALELPPTTEQVGDYAFQGCTNLASLTLNNGLSAIGTYAFSGDSKIASLAVPGSLTAFGSYAFNGCAGMKTLALGDGVAAIGDYAFQNCTGLLGGLEVPGSVRTIGNYAFSGCTNFDGALTLTSGIETIGNYAFRNCSKLNGEIVIPDSVTSIGTYAFYGCAGFNGELQLSSNIATINSYAFYGCTNITGELVIPDSVVNIDYAAFYNCSKLAGVVFGAKTARIGSSGTPVFQGCLGVMEITFKGLAVPTLYGTGELTAMANLKTVYVPREAYAAYVAAYSSRVPAGAQITVKAEGEDFLIQDGVLLAYLGSDSQVVLPAGVKSIGTGAFQNNAAITEVVFNEDLEEIGSYAFQNCTSLGAVAFPAALESVGGYAFQGCTGMTSLVLNDGLQAIGTYAFSGDNKIASLAVPGSIASFGTYAFNGCTGLMTLVIGNGVAVIGDYAFQNCTGLIGSLEVPGSVRTIGGYAFSGCTNLDGALTLNSGIETIGTYAFRNCSRLTGNLIIPDSVTSIGTYAFSGCAGFNGRLQLSANLTAISAYAFSGCSNTTGELVIPDNVVNIDYSAFYNCSKLTSVVFGVKTGRIGSSGSTAFQGCSGIEEITFKGLTVPTLNTANELTVMTNLKTVYVPQEAYAAYVSAYASRVPAGAQIIVAGGEGDFIVQDGVLLTYLGAGGVVALPEGVAEIGTGAFQNNAAVTGIVLNEGLQKIGNYAFQNCTGLTEAVFNEGLVSIGSNAFQNCTSLEALELPLALESVGGYAFQGCTGIASLVLNDGLSAIGTYAFSGDSKIAGLAVPGSVASFGTYAFNGCTGLKTLVIGNGVAAIGDYAFQNCTGLIGSLEVPGSVKSIGNYAFSGCTNLDGALTLNNGTLTIGNNAFRNCSKLAGDLTVPDSVTGISGSAFYNCSGFNGRLQLSSSLTTISSGAFYNCSNITGELVIPDNVVNVDYSAFYNCSKLSSVVFGEKTARIGSSGSTAFQGCTGIAEITFKGLAVPTLNTANELTVMTNLKTVYVPPDAYSAYVAAYSARVPAGAQIIVAKGEEDFVIQDGVLLTYLGTDELVVLPTGVTEIGTGAFQNNKAMTEIVLCEGLARIGNYAFQNCTSLRALEIPQSVEAIGDYAFQNCTSLEGGIAVPGSARTIGSGAFYGCTNLDGALTLANGIVAIGSQAFYNCSKMTGDLIVPDSVTSIGTQAFYNCSGFNGRIQLSANLATINANVFYGCANLTGELVVPDKVVTVQNYAFRGMPKLTSAVIGEKVTQIGSQAFYGCTGIADITFKGTSVPTLAAASELTVMTNLKTVYVPREAYAAYVSAYSARVPAGVEFSYETLRMPVRNLQAEKVYSKSAYLSWSPHTNESIVKYKIERNGSFLGETAECCFYDTGLATGQTYAYQVCGLTAEGEESGKAPVSATAAAPSVNSIRTDNVLNKVGATNSFVYMETPNTKNHLPMGDAQTAGQLFYLQPGTQNRVLIGSAAVKAVAASTVTYAVHWDIEGVNAGTYDVVFVLTDVDGASAEKTGQVTVDHSVPEKIVNVTAVGDINGITLSWSMSSEVDTTKYKVYRRSEIDAGFYALASITGRNVLTYRDATVAAGRQYHYYVTGVNDFGQEGPASDVASAMKGEDNEPPQVTKLTPANMSYISGSATVTATAIDNVAVTKVELCYSTDGGETWVLFQTKASAPFSGTLDTTAFADGVVRVRAIAYDAMNNVSDPLAYAYCIDNTGPEKVAWSEPPYTSTSVTVTLAWRDVADDDISFFRVERKNAGGAYAGVADVKTLGANILNLAPSTEYVFRVVGYDFLGNRGTPSDDLAASTAVDTTAPVVTNLSPRPTSSGTTYYAAGVQVSATAEDDYAVKTIAIQASADQASWGTVHTAAYDDPQKKRAASCTVDLAAYSEGPIYVRAVATDFAGNASDASPTAPFVQYIVDRTPPAAPAGVQALGRNGVIEVMWQKGAEPDLNRYSVYRSTLPDSGFLKVASSLASLNYIDRSVNEVQAYYYKVSVNDFAGNESALSETVSAQISADEEAPAIVNVFPTEGECIGPGYRTVSAYATDNRMLDEIRIEYKKEGAEYSLLQVFSAVNNHEKTVTAAVPLDGFAHGDVVWLRITATDKSGNASEPKEVSYTVDKEAPVALDPVAIYEPGSDHVTVSWESDQASDLIGYRIYRKTAAGGYALVGSQAMSIGKLNYAFTDYSIALAREQYTYRIDAMDNSGNVSSAYANPVATDNRSAPVAVITCDSVMEVGVEYEIDAALSVAGANIVAYAFDFGDGATSTSRRAVHRYAATGTYYVTLTVTDEDGNTGSAVRTVSVRDRAALGYAEIRIVDGDGKPVPNAPVYFDLGEEDQVIRATNSSGYATFTAEAGRHTVGSIIPDNNWLPVKKDIVVAAGETAKATMTLVRQTMIEGFFEIKRLTFEEIVAAGIDVSKPENQHIANITVTLTYGIETITTSFYYNGTTGASTARPIIVSGGSNGSGGGGGIYGTSSRELTPYVIDTGSGGAGDPSLDYITVAILDIPVGVAFLKEFFDVSLTIVNNASSEFSMTGNRITLDIPDGLTIMDTEVSEGGRVVLVPEIPGQTQKKITWILRGDKTGEYPVAADYVGTLALFNEEITARFASSSPIKVYGEEGVELILEYEDTVDDGWVYFNVGFHNYRDGAEDAYADLLSLEVPGAAPYAAKRSSASAGEYGSEGSKWRLEDWRLRESIEGAFDHLTVNPGEIVWKYYASPIEAFATYINEDLPWGSDSEAIGSTLVDIMVRIEEDSGVSIPVRVVPIGTKRTHLIGDGPVPIRFPASDGSSGDQALWPSAYSDGFFRNDSVKYNHTLAQMSLGLALAGFSSNDALNRAKNLLSAYQDMEFGEIELHNYSRLLDQGIPDETAFAFAHKTVVLAGREETLVSVVVRGGNYGTEWGSNFHLGDPANPASAALSPEHYGFYTSASEVKQALDGYVTEHGLAGAKFWLASYSRGAAVANIVAKQLIDEGKDVCAYLFAVPQATKMPAADKNHQSIFNIINPGDFVTDVAMSSLHGSNDWKYRRYGRDMVLPSVYSDSGYIAKYVEVRRHLIGFPRYNPYYEVGKDHLKALLVKAMPNTLAYAPMQNSLAGFAAANLNGTGNDASVLEELFGAVGLGHIFSAKPPAKASEAAIYTTTGMMVNHMPEYYAAWMQSFQPDELYKGKEYHKTLSILLRRPVAPAGRGEPLLDAVGASVVVRSPADEVVLNITGGEIVEQKIAAVLDGDLVSVYLPGDEDYTVEIIPDEDSVMSYSVAEYAGRELARMVEMDNIAVQQGEAVTGSVAGAAGADATSYQLSAGGNVIEGVDVNDVSASDAVYVNVNCAVAGDGAAEGDGLKIAGQYFSLTAYAFEGSEFSGWYEGGSLVSKNENYVFAAENDRSIVARFIKEGEGFLCGDVDGNGRVAPMDASLLSRYLAGWPGIVINRAAADVDGDGEVTPLDLMILQRHIAGWPGYEVLPYQP